MAMMNKNYEDSSMAGALDAESIRLCYAMTRRGVHRPAGPEELDNSKTYFTQMAGSGGHERSVGMHQSYDNSRNHTLIWERGVQSRATRQSNRVRPGQIARTDCQARSNPVKPVKPLCPTESD